METEASAKSPAKGGKVVLKWIGQSLFALIALFALWIVASIALSQVSIYHPNRFDQARFERIVAEIQTGKLKSNGPIVSLPPDLAGASATGRVYVTNGQIFIPTWMGRHSLVCDICDPCDEWTDGYLYSPNPLEVNPSNGIAPYNLPAFCKPWQSNGDSGSQSLGIYVQSQVKTHWYRVTPYDLVPCL